MAVVAFFPLPFPRCRVQANEPLALVQAVKKSSIEDRIAELALHSMTGRLWPSRYERKSTVGLQDLNHVATVAVSRRDENAIVGQHHRLSDVDIVWGFPFIVRPELLAGDGVITGQALGIENQHLLSIAQRRQ